MRVTFPVALLSEKAHALVIEQLADSNSEAAGDNDEENYERHDAIALRNFSHDDAESKKFLLQLSAHNPENLEKFASLNL